MAISIYHHGSFFLFLFCISFVPFTSAELLCHPFLTLVVQGTVRHGILTTNQFSFTKNYYENFNGTHYRVCICTKVPCLRKCCPLGQVYVNRVCQTHDLDINPEVYTENLQLIPDYGIWNFHRVYGDTCDSSGKFHLMPEQNKVDEYFLLPNGTLFLPFEGTLYNATNFCFENIYLETIWEPHPNRTLRVIACFPDLVDQKEEMLVYPIGMIISMPFLLITFIIYSLPELRNLHGKNLMSHVASLLSAYILLVIIQFGGETINDTFCVICGFATQYSFLATFCWLNVMCFDIWSTFSGFGKFTGHIKEKENKKFILYSLYAWGCPAIILIVTVVIDCAPNMPDFITKPNIGQNNCFFGSKLSTLAYFYGPMAVLLICDIILFILTAIKIFKVRKETKVLTGKDSRRNDEASKQRYNLYLKLFMVMGINWVTEIISWSVKGPTGLWYLTDAMNSLQGLLIFLLCVLSKTTKKKLAKRFSRASTKTDKTISVPGLFIFWIFVCSRKIKKVLISRFCPHLASRETETHTSSMKMSMSGNSSFHGTTDNIIHMNNLGAKKTQGRGAI